MSAPVLPCQAGSAATRQDVREDLMFLISLSAILALAMFERGAGLVEIGALAVALLIVGGLAG